jgi:hypothetical protein
LAIRRGPKHHHDVARTRLDLTTHADDYDRTTTYDHLYLTIPADHYACTANYDAYNFTKPAHHYAHTANYDSHHNPLKGASTRLGCRPATM